MSQLQNQVISQYLAVIRGQASLAQAAKAVKGPDSGRQSSDSLAPSARPARKGLFVDVVA